MTFDWDRVKLLEAWRGAEKAEGKGKTKGLKVNGLDWLGRCLDVDSAFLQLLCFVCFPLAHEIETAAVFSQPQSLRPLFPCVKKMALPGR